MAKKSLINSDMRRVIKSPHFYISIIIGVYVLLRPLKEAIFGSVTGTFSQFMSVPFGLSDFTPFAALFCVFPFADSFCEDYNSGYFRFISLRVGIKKYSLQRCLTVSLSGGIVMAFIVFFALIVCALLANQPETFETAQFMSGSIWWRMGVILRYNGFFLIVCKTLLGFLFGCLWALVGLAVSTIIVNKYVTLIVPFVIYQGLRSILAHSAFNPGYMLRGDNELLPSIWFVLAYQIILIVCTSFVAYYGIKRRVIV